MNGEVTATEEEVDKVHNEGFILITGDPEDCEKARDAPQALVSVRGQVAVPFKLHRFIIGQKGWQGMVITKARNEFNVTVQFSDKERDHKLSVVMSVLERKSRYERKKGKKLIPLYSVKKDGLRRWTQSTECMKLNTFVCNLPLCILRSQLAEFNLKGPGLYSSGQARSCLPPSRVLGIVCNTLTEPAPPLRAPYRTHWAV